MGFGGKRLSDICQDWIASMRRGVDSHVEHRGVVPVLEESTGEDDSGYFLFSEDPDLFLEESFFLVEVPVDVGHEGEIRDVEVVDVFLFDTEHSVGLNGLLSSPLGDGVFFFWKRVTRIPAAEDQKKGISVVFDCSFEQIACSEEHVIVMRGEKGDGFALLPFREKEVYVFAFPEETEIHEFHQ
ncbi:hypothetical protein ES703_39873 [subsurface metagenome]